MATAIRRTLVPRPRGLGPSRERSFYWPSPLRYLPPPDRDAPHGTAESLRQIEAAQPQTRAPCASACEPRE